MNPASGIAGLKIFEGWSQTGGASPIDADTRHFLFGVLITVQQQGMQRRVIHRIEATLAAAGQFLEQPCVEIGEQVGDGTIKLGQVEEVLVAQSCQYPALSD